MATTYMLTYRVKGFLRYEEVTTPLLEREVAPVISKLLQFPYVSILSLTEA